ncbi:MAG: SpoIIE family protein phosphatase [bacterium]|nr:SpoIIE family protein phosphatase [bacterium]
MKKKAKANETVNAAEVLEILRRRNETFAALMNDQLLEIMLRRASLISYEPKEYMMRQHDPSDSLYVILQGRCTVIVNDKVVGHLESGDLVGEMGVIQNTPRSASIAAIEPTTALRVPGEEFKAMLVDSKLSTWMINLLTDRLKRISYDAARVMKEMDEMVLDQMELARVQRSLLPKELPVDPRIRLHVLYSPCAYAGGDYYDAIMLDENRVLLMVADVTGHGAQASISMAIVRSFVRQGNIGKTTATILKRLNQYLFEFGPSQHFVTAQVAIIDLAAMRVQFSYAGHPPMIHLRGAKCEPLRGPRSFFLRFRPEAEFEASTMKVRPGDRFGLYTDGIIETFNAEGTMFNVDGLERFMLDSRKQPIASLPALMETRLNQFSEGSPMEDDITFLVAEVT